jgi:hypothetical protein
MPQFSLKLLFVSVTLIAVGVGLLIWFRESLPEIGKPLSPWYSYFLGLAGCMCIGLAIDLLLLKRRKPPQ